MPHCALDLAGRGLKAPRDAGIELLGDAVYNIVILRHHQHRLAQILIALDMRGDAQREKQIGHALIQAFGTLCGLRLAGLRRKSVLARNFHDPAVEQMHVERLDHIIARTQLDGTRNEIIPRQSGQHDDLGARLLHVAQLLERHKAVPPRHDDVHHQYIRLKFSNRIRDLRAVGHRSYDVDILLTRKKVRQKPKYALVVIRQQEPYFIHIAHPFRRRLRM